MFSHKSFLISQKKKYYKIGLILCPALDNEKIYFNNHGFNHLIRKRGKLRSKYEQKRRFSLLTFARDIVGDKTVSVEYVFNKNKENRTYFYILEKEIDKKIIKIVIRKINNSKLHFFSIMDKNKTPPLKGVLY